MSPDLRKVHDTSGEVRFEHPHASAWKGAVIGAVIAGAGFLWLDGGVRWVLVVLGALMVYGAISNALYRMELVLDFARRRYTFRRGKTSAIESSEGTFDDIEAVVLKKELDRKNSKSVEEWEVELILKEWGPVEVLETRDEATARRDAEDLARRIGVELKERTSY